MPELAPLHPCPVCLGVMMDRSPVGAAGASPVGPVVLDHCGRCGGVWFDAGEVQRLRAHGAEALRMVVAPRETSGRMQCHSCHAHIDRNVERCPGCDWRNVIDCPTCQRPMQAATEQGVRLDVCRHCRGVWFDHDELAAVWRMEFSASLARRRASSRLADAADPGAFLLLDALTYSPWLVVEGARAGAHVAALSAEALADAPEAVGAVVEAAGEASAGVFEAIAEIVAGLFS